VTNVTANNRGLTRVHFFHRRERVIHIVANSMGFSLTDYLQTVQAW